MSCKRGIQVLFEQSIHVVAARRCVHHAIDVGVLCNERLPSRYETQALLTAFRHRRDDYRFATLLTEVVKSPMFRMKKIPPVEATPVVAQASVVN